MGSRRGRHAALVAGALAAAASLGGCAVGAPPGFSEGDRWMIPLVGPLEDGLLIVPALVNGKGPFLFAIDPDAHVSIVDQEVVKQANARSGEGPKLLDESDTQHTRFYAEILEWTLGTLTVKGPMPAQMVPPGTFDTDGRRVHGVIGRDIIADSLVFSFDRDAGTVTLSTQKNFRPPAGAMAISYSSLRSQITNAQVVPAPRKLTTASIGGQRFAMHVDFGEVPSQLRPRSWTKAKLVESDVQAILVDEVGMKREIKKQGLADAVSVGTATTKHVVFLPYGDRRWPDQDIEGALGLSFFRPYSIVANWDKSTLYLSPRNDPTLAVPLRIGRWQSKTLSSCQKPGCVTAKLIDPFAGKPPEELPEKHPGVVISVVRDPEAKALDLEVLVAVTPAEGKPPLHWIVANLPSGTDRAMIHAAADHLGAQLTVLDASPFPRRCPTEGACIDRIEPPMATFISTQR